MRKLVALALLSFTILQSCKVEEAEVAPDISVTPARVNIESAVKSMKGFILEDYKALLLKPVDDDPQTNLTTFFIADAKGKIWPVMENFEVKDVQVTRNGIYVLTNYFDRYRDPNYIAELRDPIAFFVKYDNTWVQLKRVGVLAGEDDNNNLVFQKGAILNTQTLQVDNSFVTRDDYVRAISGNHSFVMEINSRGIPLRVKIRDHVTRKEYPLSSNPHVTREGIVSFKGTDLALVPFVVGPFSQADFIDMKTGKRTAQQAISESLLYSDIIRLDDGSIVGLDRGFITQFSVKRNNNGEVVSDRILSSSVKVAPNVSKGALLGSDKYYVVKETHSVKVFDKSLKHKGDILAGLSNITMSLVDALVYYSGIENGKPVSGFYNLETNQNTVLDNKYVFSNIQPL